MEPAPFPAAAGFSDFKEGSREVGVGTAALAEDEDEDEDEDEEEGRVFCFFAVFSLESFASDSRAS